MQLTRLALLLGVLSSCPPRASSAPPEKNTTACMTMPALEDGALDAAERRLREGEAVVRLDDKGCLTARRLPSEAGVFRFQLERSTGAPSDVWVSYRRQSTSFSHHDWLDQDGDGFFERELVDEWNDAGWVADELIVRPDAGPWRRIRDELGPNRWSKRSLRQLWADGGWLTESDTVGDRHPPVVPITR